jgi:hypothetical protein
LLPPFATSTKEANMVRSSSPHIFLLPHYNCTCSYMAKNKTDQGWWVPLLLPTNPCLRLGS